MSQPSPGNSALTPDQQREYPLELLDTVDAIADDFSDALKGLDALGDTDKITRVVELCNEIDRDRIEFRTLYLNEVLEMQAQEAIANAELTT